MTTQVVAHPVQHLLSVRDFYKMGEVGILGPDDRVELIEGALIDMAPIGSPHAGMVTRLTNLFAQLLAGRAVLSPQNPVRLGEHSEPQPDLTVLRAREDFYADAHPEPADVLLSSKSPIRPSGSTGRPRCRSMPATAYRKSG